MGHTLTAKYQVQMLVPGWYYPPQSWNCKRDGRPTEANLQKFVESFEASTQPGGVNAHLGVTVVPSAKIRVNEVNGRIVTEYKAPMFRLVTTDHNI